jgi:Subtilase family
MESLDVDQRETLERMNVNIVEEITERRDNRTLYRLLVQFPDDAALTAFMAESDQYARENTAPTALLYALRRDFFDTLESVSTVSPDERRGRRLQREGIPTSPRFYLDVDLWNPGADDAYLAMRQSLREFVQARGGRLVKDPLRIPSLVLVKVEATAQLLDDLLQLDLVSLVDLPPLPPAEDSFDLFQPVAVPTPLPPIPNDGPLACVVDSGVLAGHPLLAGTVLAEEDFDSGEGTPVDQNGHGTQVGGLVVYGDIARRIAGNEWLPQVQICSAKVLRNRLNPVDPANSDAAFPDEERVEDQLRRAIEYFHREYGCRVFNLSIGHLDKVYLGGRQLPWVELLDELARRLDIVIIVSAGNVPDVDIPTALNSPQFQKEVINSLKTEKHRLIDPATAALCVTVGAIARRDDPSMLSLGMRLAASPRGCPSLFMRCGPGIMGAVKPEVVAPGENFAVDSLAGTAIWRRQDPNLGEPTLNRNFPSGRLLRAACGTSFAAAQVPHIAARMEAALRNQFGEAPSQNLVRALLVNSARIDANIKEWLGEQPDDILRTVGYGQPSVEFCWSVPNRVTLVTEEVVPYKSFHVYSLIVPESFLQEKGKRSITVSLAYDPPTRLSRRDYIATAM